MIKAFFIAIGLMTRIPVPSLFHIKEGDSDKLYGWSVIFYPLVGLIIGGLLVSILWGLSLLSLSTNGLIEAAIILSVWILITGALHLDGLADSADAWLGGYGDQKRTLEIMKDPYSGPAAVVVLVLILLLKFSAISILTSAEWIILLLSPVLARTAIMVLLATTPYVREGGMGESAAKELPKSVVWFVSFIVLAVSIFLLKENIWGLILLLVLGYTLRNLMIKRVGGTTGDTAGAMLEVMEVAVLLVFLILSNI